MTTALAVTAVVISLGALGVALWQGSSNRRSAVAAEDSAVTSRQAADYARESAEHAKASAEAADRVAQSEVGRDHETYRPMVPHQFTRVANPRTGKDNLFFEFWPKRTYRMAADLLLEGGGMSPASIDPGPVIEAGRRTRVYIGEVGGMKLPEGLSMRFWPPEAGDPGESWQCPCGRTDDGDFHWVWNRQIEVPPEENPPMVVWR